jgi:hypothetical protein
MATVPLAFHAAEERQQRFIASGMHFLSAGETYAALCGTENESALTRSDLDDGRLGQLLSLLPESAIISDCRGRMTIIGKMLCFDC